MSTTKGPEQAKVSIRTVLGDGDVRAVILAAFVVMTGLGLVLPILPIYARSFDVSFAAAGLFTSLWGFARLVTDLVAGPLVDRYGERVTAMAGLTVIALCSLGAGLAPSFPLAVSVWAVGGAGSAVSFAAQYSYLLKTVNPTQMARTLGVFYGAFNLGFIVGGFAGGIIADRFGLASPLFVYVGLLAISTGLYARYVPDPPPKEVSPELTTEEALAERDMPVLRRGKVAFGRLFRTPGFVTVLVVNFSYMWMVATIFETLVPLFGTEELDMSTVGVGLVFAVAVATEFAVLYPAGSLADRFGRRTVMIPALTALAITSATLGLAAAPVVLACMMGLHGIASGFAGVPPAAMLSDVVPEHMSGTGVGMFRFAGDLAFFLGPLAAGAVAEALDFKSAFPIAALPVLVSLVMVIRTQETLRR